jgi:toxin ParE1/3/4
VIRIELAPEVLDDFERIIDHLLEHGVVDAADRIAGLTQALDILREHPSIGRPAGDGQRELVIGRGSRGYLARYRFVESVEIVFVLAVKAQSEANYRR